MSADILSFPFGKDWGGLIETNKEDSVILLPCRDQLTSNNYHTAEEIIKMLDNSVIKAIVWFAILNRHPANLTPLQIFNNLEHLSVGLEFLTSGGRMVNMSNDVFTPDISRVILYNSNVFRHLMISLYERDYIPPIISIKKGEEVVGTLTELERAIFGTIWYLNSLEEKELSDFFEKVLWHSLSTRKHKTPISIRLGWYLVAQNNKS